MSKYIFKVLGQHFGLAAARVEEFLDDEKSMATISDFLRGDERVTKLLFFYQSRDTFTEDGEFIEASDTAEPQLFLTSGDVDRQKGAAIFFLRLTKPGVEVNESKPEEGLSFGTLPARAMEGLQAMLSDVYLPMLNVESSSWKPGVGAEDSTTEFFSAYSKFGETLGEAVASLQGGFALRRPENLFDIENKAAAFNRAGGEPHIVKAFEEVAEEWCSDTEKLLGESDSGRGVRRLPWHLGHALA